MKKIGEICLAIPATTGYRIYTGVSMKACCNKCQYTWRVRKLQVTARRCPICRGYDIDYEHWGTPVLPNRYIPHETGDALIRKRILPLLQKLEDSVAKEDLEMVPYYIEELPVLFKQAKRRNADTTNLLLARQQFTQLEFIAIDMVKAKLIRTD
jgi:hypothetical protein